MWCAQCFLHSNCWGCGLSRSGLRKSIGHNCCYWWWWWWWWVVGCGLWVVGRRAVLAQGHAGLPQGSFQPLPATLCFSMTCFSSCDQSDDIDSVSVMFRANPAWHFMTEVMTSTQCAQCFVQIQHVELTPCFVVCPLCFAFDVCSVQFLWPKWWHRLSVRNVSCKSSTLKWHQVLWCTHCVFAFDMYSVQF